MRAIETNGVTLAVDDQGSRDAIVLLHGFPELAYSWRHQIPALVDAGYRVIAFDQRGYGGSSKPDAVAEYSLHHLVGDVIGILDRLGVESATLVGHDWGSIVAWTAAVKHPDRVSRIVSLNAGVESWLSRIYRPMAADKDFLTDSEFSVYVEAFKEGGITGPLNWYRNIDANAAAFADVADAPVSQPTLMIAADGDPVLPVSLTVGMDRWISDLTTVIIEGSGHWTQQEQPEAVNSALIAWLDQTS